MLHPFRKLAGQRQALRRYSVVAWGQNSHGQCGVGNHVPAVFTPQEVSGLNGENLNSLHASSKHSAAVTSEGDVYTFGCGAFGKLGLGRTDPSFLPSRVETLVSRSRIISAALGQQHSLFLDENGSVHACGVSSDGGHDAVAMQMEAEGGNSLHADHFPTLRSGVFPSTNGGSRGGFSQGHGQWRSGGNGMAPGSEAAAVAAAAAAAAAPVENLVPSWQLVPLVDHRSRSHELGFTQSLYTDQLRSMVHRDSAGRHYKASSTTGLLGAHDVEYNRNFSIPVRLGSAAAMLRSQEKSMASVEACGATGGSIVLSKDGQPLQLKLPRRWAAAHSDVADRHAALLLPISPCPLLSQVLADNGGAVQVAAGAGFFAALTASQKLILWLNHAVSAVTGRPLDQIQVEQHGPVTLRALGNTMLAEYTDLPPLTSIAAGHTSVVVSDGHSVWQVKVHGASKSSESASTTATGPFQPSRVLSLTDERVTSLSAGGSAAAAVTDAGRLWLWGDVLSKESAETLLKKVEEEEGFGHWSYSGGSGDENGFNSSAKPWWPGLGSPEPIVVPGLHGVKKVALGASHALVEVA